MFNNNNNESGEQNNTKTKVCYARVSSHHQAEDLQRQISDLQQAYPHHEVISDIGSGLNFKRKGFTTLLERVYSSEICEVVVMHRDRLCRYGIEFVQWLFDKKQVRLLVHGQAETSETRELADDLLAITNVFVARHNGRRAPANKRARKLNNRTINEAADRGSDQVQVVPEPGTVG